MKRDILARSERETYSLPVDPDMDSTLIEVLKYRGTFVDETEFVAETGKTHPEAIRAVNRTTGSLLEYSDGILQYTEGERGAKADDHAAIFMNVTVIESDDPQARDQV